MSRDYPSISPYVAKHYLSIAALLGLCVLPSSGCNPDSSIDLDIILAGIQTSEARLEGRLFEATAMVESIESQGGDLALATQTKRTHQKVAWLLKGHQWVVREEIRDPTGEQHPVQSIQIFDGRSKTDLLVRSDLRRAIISADAEYNSTTRSIPPWECLFGLVGDSVSEDLGTCQHLRVVGREEVRGVDCIVLDFTYDELTSGSLWIAPSRNHWIMRSEVHGEDFGCVRVTHSLRKWKDEFWLPANINYRLDSIHDGRLLPKWRIAFSLNRVTPKQDIDRDPFQLSLPPDTLVVDETENTSYLIPPIERQFRMARQFKQRQNSADRGNGGIP